jgi:amidohydrolase
VSRDDSEVAELIRVRRDIHAHPELGYQETRTAGIAADRLRALGYEVRTGIGGTGVLGVLPGARPGRTLLLRADMDALPIHEANDLPWRSTVPGVMHACGHDGHVAMGLGVARRLAARRAELGGTIVYAFQPAEEGGCGARKMIEDGALEAPKVDAAFGIHLWNDLPTGTIAVTPGPFMAAVDEFRITVRGVGGHAAQPQRAVDPIVAAAHLVTALQSLVSRATDPFEQLVVSVTAIHAGEAFNVIPETAELRGTVRTLDRALWEKVPEPFRAVVNGVAAALACTAEIAYNRQSPPVVNEPGFATLVADAAAALVGEAQVRSDVRSMGGEDFAFFGQRVPACFAFVGSRNPAKGADAPHHSPRFDFDEDALPIGVDLIERVARSYLT